MTIKEEIHALSENLIENLGRLVAVDSQLGTPLEGMPFGEGPAKVLNEGLKIAEELGFRTVNLDNYCGYAEMGEGEEIVGIAGHLDIVPAGGGWTHDPFQLTREGDFVYGRGVTDDKGPVLEALYAMKLLRDSGMKLNKRVRLIMGCNEETGSRCMEHYNKVEEKLSCGFTPDANFPCIHGEKGHMSMMAYSKNTRIISINGGFVSNAVCDECTAVIPAEDGLKERLELAFSETKLSRYQITEDNGRISIYAKGVPAHASTPTLGVNAAGVTFECLEKAGFEDDFVRFYNTHIGTACDGQGVGLKFEDEYGELTFCNGIVKTQDGIISCTIDIRVPVTLREAEIRKMCEGKLEDENGRIEIKAIGDPLFFPKESPLVEALYKAYADVTGDTKNEPMVIGGGTYAKSLDNIIAFGPEKTGMDYHIHGADEFLLVSDMEEAVQIYMEAIKNLLAI
ncbi:MAG: M20 family metallopeptidase [Lachnospiraceae bacterium]|nr:M20 family metallopeptidase [Lachnospiraceae bacterium]